MSIVLANLPASIVVTNLLTSPTVAGNIVLPPGVTTISLVDASPAYKSQIWLQLTQLELAGFISCSPHTQTLVNPATGPQEPPYTQAPADASGQTYEPADPSDWTTIISAIPTTVAVALDLLAAAVLAGGGGVDSIRTAQDRSGIRLRAQVPSPSSQLPRSTRPRI